jgi:ribose/xylose/arabinose/galactoside ABC-type transport system permease subunit
MKIAEKFKEFGNNVKSQFVKDEKTGKLPLWGTLKKGCGFAWREGTTYIIFIVLVIFFTCFNPKFISGTNLLNIITGSTFTIIAGMGIVFVMLTGGIDLSVGYIMATSACMAFVMIDAGLPIAIVFILCILIGFVMGLINGVLAAKLKLFPLILTLATQMVFQGIALTISGGKTYYNLPDSFRNFFLTEFLGLPMDVWIALLFVICIWFVLNKTRFGRDVLAVGGNKECARLSGIKVDLITTLCFAICGAVFAFAGLDMIAQQNSATASSAGIEFTCLTAAIIGGISMIGGKGNVIGLVFGIFIMQIIANGMQLAGLGSYAQYIVKGAILIAAVSFDVIKNLPKGKIRIKKVQRDAQPLPEKKEN